MNEETHELDPDTPPGEIASEGVIAGSDEVSNPEATNEDTADQNPVTEDTAASEAATAGVATAVFTDAPSGISPELLDDPYGEDTYDVSRDDFEKLLIEHAGVIGDFKEGEIVQAKVLRVTDSAVILEFGFKSEGSVSIEEFKDPEELNTGDEIEVLLESLEDDDGVVVLSKKKADFLRVWEKIKEAYESDTPVEGVLTRKIKGGVTVDLMGVDAFLPGSQIALRRVPNIEDLLGETYDFKIIKLNKRRRNIVVSRRVILESEREEKRDALVKELVIGQVREGIVKNITDFGAFIDLGGLDGLLHITDMSWGRVGHPSEVVEIGESVDVKILDIDWERERISLGLKQLQAYPWADIDQKYPVGTRVKGRVVSITNYGAFVELEKGVEGLVHISEMSWTRNIRHPSKLVNIGDEIEAVVLKVDPGDEKISLGMKQTEEDPWLALPLKYPTGTKLKGAVRNLTSFGAFVEIEPGIDGLVHVSDMSWTRRIEHPSEVIQKGDEVEVMVLDVDAENKRISLGLKQLHDDPWPKLSENFTPEMECEGTVRRVQEKGVDVDLGDEIEGFVPLSHSGVDDATRLDEYYRPGEPLDLRVMESDAANRRIVVEVLAVPERKAKPKVEAPEVDASEPTEGEGFDGDAGEIPAESGIEEPTAEAEAPEAGAEEETADDETPEDIDTSEDEEVEDDSAEEAEASEEEVEEDSEEAESESGDSDADESDTDDGDDDDSDGGDSDTEEEEVKDEG